MKLLIMSQKDVGNKIPIYKLKKTDEVMRYYDDWGIENKYDQDMVDWNYTGPKETVEVAHGKKANYLKEFGYENGEGHQFITASQESITKITKALDFKYVAISDTSDYSHPTVTYYVTPKGKISRFITGFGFNAQDIRLSLLDAGQGKIGSILDNALLRCYRFDPKNKTYVRNSMLFMSVAGAMTLISLALFLGFMWYHEFKNKDKSTT